MERQFAEAVAALPDEENHTPTRPLTGGRAAWDALAARLMFECPRD
ncbi:hypothetical protein [Streptomyces carpinensis]|nr:hypothetical protein [Streptomyces carpinensis]